MTRPFLQQHTLHLTPLSPLHLGTGEDYEPTGYVISDGMMYVFDPSQALLNPTQYTELMTAAQGSNILDLQKFFKKHADTFKNCAYKAIGVNSAFENEYKNKLGKAVQNEGRGRKVANLLEIQCTATNPTTHQPYIPGSAFKGCVRTAVLDTFTKDNPPASMLVAKSSKSHRELSINDHETQQLGSFASDIMRLLKAADFMPSEQVSTQIQYAVNKKKRKVPGPNGREAEPKGITTRRESIQHGQYRAFRTTLSLQTLILDHNPAIKDREKSIPRAQGLELRQIVQAVNQYHLPRLFPRLCNKNRILDEHRLINPAWLQDTEHLLRQLKPQLDSGQIMLMRLGKNGGAESKTLTNHAQIKIMQGSNQKPTFEAQTKTVWLAADSENATHGMLPFGWVLVEINATGDNPALQDWCSKHSSHLTDIRAINTKLAEYRLQNEARKREAQEQAAREAAEKMAAAQAAQAAEHARAAELAAMTPAERLISEQLEALDTFTYDARNQQASTTLYQAFVAALTQAQSFSTDEQKHVAESLTWKIISSKQPQLFSGKREKEIKALLRLLRGEA